jgi:TP901-1 family phage major tail protein
MSKIAGIDVLVKIKNDLGVATDIGGQSGASIELGAEAIDVSDKSSKWASSIAGRLSYSISCEGFIVEDDVALELLETKFLNRETVEVEINFPSGKKYEGTCIISSFPLEMAQDSAVSYSLELVGVGELVVTP